MHVLHPFREMGAVTPINRGANVGRPQHHVHRVQGPNVWKGPISILMVPYFRHIVLPPPVVNIVTKVLDL